MFEDFRTMPIKRNANNEIYESQKAASKEWEKSQDKIILRVPHGSRDTIMKYVESKAKEDPENPRYSSLIGKSYRPSVNAFIKSLIEEELGEPLKPTP